MREINAIYTKKQNFSDNGSKINFNAKRKTPKCKRYVHGIVPKNTGYVPVKLKLQHPPPPPGATPRAFDFLEN